MSSTWYPAFLFFDDYAALQECFPFFFVTAETLFFTSQTFSMILLIVRIAVFPRTAKEFFFFVATAKTPPREISARADHTETKLLG